MDKLKKFIGETSRRSNGEKAGRKDQSVKEERKKRKGSRERDRRLLLYGGVRLSTASAWQLQAHHPFQQLPHRLRLPLLPRVLPQTPKVFLRLMHGSYAGESVARVP